MSRRNPGLDPTIAALIARVEALDRPPLETIDAWALKAPMQQVMAATAFPQRADIAHVESVSIPRADGRSLQRPDLRSLSRKAGRMLNKGPVRSRVEGKLQQIAFRDLSRQR